MSQDVIDLEQMPLGLPVQRRRDVKAGALALTPKHRSLNLSSAAYKLVVLSSLLTAWSLCLLT